MAIQRKCNCMVNFFLLSLQTELWSFSFGNSVLLSCGFYLSEKTRKRIWAISAIAVADAQVVTLLFVHLPRVATFGPS